MVILKGRILNLLSEFNETEKNLMDAASLVYLIDVKKNPRLI